MCWRIGEGRGRRYLRGHIHCNSCLQSDPRRVGSPWRMAATVTCSLWDCRWRAMRCHPSIRRGKPCQTPAPDAVKWQGWRSGNFVLGEQTAGFWWVHRASETDGDVCRVRGRDVSGTDVSPGTACSLQLQNPGGVGWMEDRLCLGCCSRNATKNHAATIQHRFS